MSASCFTSMKEGVFLRLTFAVFLFLLLCFQRSFAAPTVTSAISGSPKLKVGDSIVLTCEVTEYEAALSVRLECPLSPASGNCFEDCTPVCTKPELCEEEPRLRQITCAKSESGGRAFFTYTINNMDPKFTGIWYCKYMGATSRNDLRLDVIENPSILTISAHPPTIAESQSSDLRCLAKAASGTLRFTWTRSHTASIPHSPVHLNSSFSELRIRDAKRSDTDNYVCRVENEVGVTTSRSIALAVNYPPSNVQITSSLPSPGKAGTPITFRCQVSGGQPTPAVLFYRERPGQPRQEISSSGTITLDRADNQAKFYCKAVSAGIIGGEMWSNAITFNVFFPPLGVSMSSVPDGAISTGSKKEFTCITTSGSNPPSTAVWFAITPSGFQQSIPTTSFSTIQKPAGDSASQAVSKYEVIADKTKNMYTYRCTIFYQDKEIGQQQSSLSVVFPPESNKILATPSGGVQETHSLTLFCETGTASPKPSVQWFKTPVGASSPTDRTFMATTTEKNGDYQGISVTSKIIISDTYRKDNNCVYSCVIRQEGSTTPITLKHTLRVLYPPDVKVTLTPAEPVEGDRVELRCVASDGNPDKSVETFIYMWNLKTPDGKLTSLSNRNDVNFIDKVSYSDIGEYQCLVENSGGTSQGKVDLVIKYAPTIDKSVPTTVSASVGQVGIIELPVKSNPPFNRFQWFKKLTDGSKQALNQSVSHNLNFTVAGSILTLRILNVTWSDYAVYSCIVTNSLGSREFFISVVAPGPPDAPTSFHILNATAISAQFSWRSELRGGSPQVFSLQWKLSSSDAWKDTDQVTGIPDPGFHQPVYYTVVGFLSSTQYTARVRAINQNKNGSNTSPFSNLALFTTKTRPTILSSSLGVAVRDGVAYIQFTPPDRSQFTGIELKFCQTSNGYCISRTLLDSEASSGRVSIVLPDPSMTYYFLLIVKDGNIVVFESETFKESSKPQTAGLSFEIVLGISVGSAIAVAVLLAAVIVTAIIQCRRNSDQDKSIRSTNSSDVTSGSQRSPGNPMGQLDPSGLQYPCRSSVTTSQDLFYGQSHSVTDLSPTSRMSHEFPPAVIPYSGMYPSRTVMATSNGSLVAPPDVVLSDSNTELYRANSRTSVASNRSRSSLAANGGFHVPNPIPENYLYFPAHQVTLDHRKAPVVSLGDYPPGVHMPIYVATPLSPHMESNLETIENYV